MHIEKNVCESLIGTLLNIPGKTKDGIKARLDLKKLGIQPELAPRVENDKNFTYLPPTSYTMSTKEKDVFCKCLEGVKVPDGYSSNLRNFVSTTDKRLYGLKSHDCHILMQQLLPVAIRSILPKYVRLLIIRLCSFFNTICKKSISIGELNSLQKDVVDTLCLIEKYFPPSFFDIMIHLCVHLVREVQLCGPTYLRWMYPFERYMQVLKEYVNNRN